jgi:hypothetical protein
LGCEQPLQFGGQMITPVGRVVTQFAELFDQTVDEDDVFAAQK